MVVALVVVIFIVIVLTCSSATSRKRLLACDLVVNHSTGYGSTQTVGDDDADMSYLGAAAAAGKNLTDRKNSGIILNNRNDSSTSGICISENDGRPSTGSGSRGRERVVVIGDVHGSYEGLIELLYYSNITVSERSCRWREQAYRGVMALVGGI